MSPTIKIQMACLIMVQDISLRALAGCGHTYLIVMQPNLTTLIDSGGRYQSLKKEVPQH
jgi:hypothetical protein